MRTGATAAIISFARKQPGGVIRWHEAAGIYRDARGISRHNHHYHMNVGKVLRVHFTRVEGTQGFYVLNESMDASPVTRWESRVKERVVHRCYVDGSYSGSSEHLMFVYRRPDGTEFIDQKRMRPVARIGGRPTVDTYCKTVQAFDLTGLLRSMGRRV